MKSPLVTIGIVFGKNDLKYLTYTLKSVFDQTYTNFEVIMHNNVLNEDDVQEDDKVWKWIEESYPKVKLERSGNIGFGPAHNEMMRKMQGDYYLCYNPDIILEPNFLESLIAFINESQDEKIGVIGGRLMYWDFIKRETESLGKTNQIDSLGLKIKKTHRVVDIGQGEEVERVKLKVQSSEVFGLSGALFMASKKALDAVVYNIQIQNSKKSPLRGLGGVEYKNNKVISFNQKLKNGQLDSRLRGNDNSMRKEFFDETMFLYKEDVDLAYRFRLAGFKTFVVNNAVAYHDRSVEGNTGIIGSRKSKKRIVKGQTINTWSFFHHHIMLYKNWQSGFSLQIKLATFFYELFSTLYLLFFEISTFWNGWKLFKKNFKEIKRRKKMTLKVVSAKEIESWMFK